MASNTQIETVSTSADKAKLAGAGALLLTGLVAFYVLTKQGAWVQWGALLVCIAAAVVLFLTAESGKSLVAFGREAWREVRKVVWPTRKEAMQMTGYVFGFVLLMSLFLFMTDKTLEWVFYDLILGWKK
jgi:preprotein translocase subunit SecE